MSYGHQVLVQMAICFWHGFQVEPELQPLPVLGKMNIPACMHRHMCVVGGRGMQEPRQGADLEHITEVQQRQKRSAGNERTWHPHGDLRDVGHESSRRTPSCDHGIRHLGTTLGSGTT